MTTWRYKSVILDSSSLLSAVDVIWIFGSDFTKINDLPWQCLISAQLKTPLSQETTQSRLKNALWYCCSRLEESSFFFCEILCVGFLVVLWTDQKMLQIYLDVTHGNTSFTMSKKRKERRKKMQCCVSTSESHGAGKAERWKKKRR